MTFGGLPAGAPSPRRGAIARKLVLALGAFAAALLAAELGHRGVRHLRGHPYRSADVERAIRATLERVTERLPTARDPAMGAGADPLLILHPYAGFDLAEAQVEFAAGAHYFRTPEAEAAFDVLLVGGSVAAHFGMESGTTLVGLLEADPRLAGRAVRLFMHPRGGIKEPQQLALVSYLFVLGWRPDAVIDVNGFNELALSNYNAQQGVHPVHPSQPHWAHLASGSHSSREGLDLVMEVRRVQLRTEALAQRALDLGLARSSVLGSYALSRVLGAGQAYFRAYGRYADYLAKLGGDPSVQGPPVPADFAQRLEIMVRCWVEASRSLHALCAARGCLYLHVLQPTLLDAGSKPLSEAELLSGQAGQAWTEAIVNGYPHLRERGAALRAEGLRFLDASLLFADVREDLYYDACHFTRPGNERLAAVIAAALLEALPPR